MKTAMQLMLDDLELRYKVLSDAQMIQACGAIEGTIEYAKSLILKEKEQFHDMFEEGFESAYQHFVNGKDFVKFEEYYNQTYNQNK